MNDTDKGTFVKTEDGKLVYGNDRVYNYYDMEPGIIVEGTITEDGPNAGWFTFENDRGRRNILNGQRICTIAYAKHRGFPNAE